MEIGVISDTHGVLEPEVERAFRAARLGRILHAGDIGGPEVLRRLSAIAGVSAVAGNCDAPPFSRGLPQRLVLDVDGCKVLLLHDLGREDRPGPEVEGWIHREEPRVVVFGHLHRPVIEERGGVLYFNPGSAGLGRGGVPRSYGFLRIESGQPQGRTERLDGD